MSDARRFYARYKNYGNADLKLFDQFIDRLNFSKEEFFSILQSAMDHGYSQGRAQVAALEAQLQQKTQEAKSLESNLQQKTQYATSLTDQYNSLANQYNSETGRLVNQHNTLLNRTGSLTSEYKALADQHNTLLDLYNSETSRLTNGYSILVNQLTDERNTFQQQTQTLQQEVKALEGNVDSLKNQLTDEKNTREAYNVTIENLEEKDRQQAQAMQREIEQLRSQLQEMKSLESKAERLSDRLLSERESHKSTLEVYNKTIEGLENETAQLKNRLREKEAKPSDVSIFKQVLAEPSRIKKEALRLQAGR